MTGRSMEGVKVPVSAHMLELQSFHTAMAQREAATWLWSHSSERPERGQAIQGMTS